VGHWSPAAAPKDALEETWVRDAVSLVRDVRPLNPVSRLFIECAREVAKPQQAGAL